MSTPTTRRVYLSAVRAELQSYRDELAFNLTQRDLLVKCREDFADISKGRHSYAQWEYLFGSHVAKAVYAF